MCPQRLYRMSTSTQRPWFMNGFCGGTNYIDHHVRVGEHDDMAAGDLRHFGAYALSQEALTVRLYRAVVLGDDVPAWLRFPGSSSGGNALE